MCNIFIFSLNYIADIALHFNPRLDQNKVVFNDRKGGQWGQEEPQPLILMQVKIISLSILQKRYMLVNHGKKMFYFPCTF